MVDASNTASSSTSTGVGQQDPFDSNSANDVTFFIVRQMMAQLEKMKLVQVVKVTGGGNSVAAAGTVDVQLLVNQLDGGGNAIKQGVVYGVPWVRLQGGKSAVIVDPVKGDIGFVLCEDRDISNVKSAASGGKSPQANPGSYRRNSISDGIYIGAILGKDAPEQYLFFNPDGGTKLLDKFGNKVETLTSGIKITDKSGNVVETTTSGIKLTPVSGMAVTVDGNLIVNQNLQLAGSLESVTGGIYGGLIKTSGDVQAGAISLTSHKHTQGNDSHGDTEVLSGTPT